MQRYLITNPRYTGEATVIFANGLLQLIDLSQTDMDATTITHFKKAVPSTVSGLAAAFGKETIIVESEIIITFEEFWKKYDYKFKRDRAEQLYNRLSKTNQLLAFYGLDKYNKYLRKMPDQAKLYPDTYLRNKAWLNDYK